MDRLRHVGKLANTDQRLIVVFMQIPNRADHALIIPVDALPPRYEQAVMDVLKSPEGQNEECFANALARRIMPDTGKDILVTLHEARFLNAVPCAQVIMMPMPNQPVKLTEVLVALGRLRLDDVIAQQEKFNPHLNNMRVGDAENRQGIANNLLLQANDFDRQAREMQNEAKKKRELAYSYVPHLRQDNPSDRLVETPKAVPAVIIPEMFPDVPDVPIVKSQFYDSAQLSLDSLLQE